jgi:hypothetical protein
MALSVSVTDLNSSGLTLVPYNTARSASLLTVSVPAAISATLEPLLPYSVFIINDSQKTILAYTVRWTSVDQATNTPYTDDRTVCDAISLKGLISPHGYDLVTIVGPVSSFGSITKSAQILRQITDEGQRLKAQMPVSISLEAVMFEDGSVTGGDTPRSISQIRARLRSEYDLYTAVLARASTDTIIPWLQGVSNQIRPGGRLSFDADPFSQWYQFYQARTASGLLEAATTKGIPEMISYVQSALRNKHYPALVVN